MTPYCSCSTYSCHSSFNFVNNYLVKFPQSYQHCFILHLNQCSLTFIDLPNRKFWLRYGLGKASLQNNIVWTTLTVQLQRRKIFELLLFPSESPAKYDGGYWVPVILQCIIFFSKIKDDINQHYIYILKSYDAISANVFQSISETIFDTWAEQDLKQE